MAVDLESQADAVLENYAKRYCAVAKQCATATGMARTVTFAEFNDTYCYGRDMRLANGRSTFMYRTRGDIDKLPHPEYGYLKRILTLCLRSDICQKLNISAFDLMQLDLATFEFIEQEYYTNKPVEQDTAEAAIRDMQRELAKKSK